MAKVRPKHEALYARRNILHCKAVGVVENAKAALARLNDQKRAPQWLRAYLSGIITRGEAVADEMARHRDEAW